MKGSPWFAYAWKVLRECCMTSQRTSKTTKTLQLNPKKENSLKLKCQKFCFCLGFFFFFSSGKEPQNDPIENCIYQIRKHHNLNEGNTPRR